MPIESFPMPAEGHSDKVIAEIWQSGTFDAQSYLEKYPDVAVSGIDPLVHYVRHGAYESRDPCSHFDSHYYLKNNEDVEKAGMNPLYHFCTAGWKELRKPCPDFDVWWYWSNYLNPSSEDVNPLSHYLREGKLQGLSPKPNGPFSQSISAACKLGQNIKRICLFAGYDPEGIIDDYVITYLKALSRHADVYYLADCIMSVDELKKLSGIVKGAWAGRHDMYDFGSYALLAKSLVGWDEINKYDELLLVNDSAYLLKELDEIFDDMDVRACDWWGLQATKGIAKTRGSLSNQYKKPIPINVVRASMLDAFEKDDCYDFLIGSYFLAFRRPVLESSEFKKLINSVTKQTNKQNIIQKYEIGITRHLIAKVFVFDTFITDLYPFHPIYTNWYFQMVGNGFPLLKRLFLSSNHYSTPHLYRWKEKIQRLTPTADTDVIERNLKRVVPQDVLEKNLYLGTSAIYDDGIIPSTLLDNAEFSEADCHTPKYDNWWAFPACAFTGAFSGNERAVFDEVKDKTEIRKIILTRGKSVDVQGQNVITVPLESPEGQFYLLRSKIILIKHTPTRNLVYPVSSQLHHIINLWHGIPLKRIGHTSLDQQTNLDSISREHSQCKAVISSSQIDTMAMAAAFYPLSYNDVWMTGLPRTDFILRDFNKLPPDFQKEALHLRNLLEGRQLVLFMPTFRNGGKNSYYQFSHTEKVSLERWLQKSNAVLGIREHMADVNSSYTDQLKDITTLPLPSDEFPNPEILYREASSLITDYSSCFIDMLPLDKPVFSFAFDLEYYSTVERGFFYDLEHVFPGPICRSFKDLLAELEDGSGYDSMKRNECYQFKKRIFFEYFDDKNSERLIKKIEQLLD